MTAPSGTQHRLQADGPDGPVVAVVTEVGAALRVLEVGGRPLVRAWPETELMPVFSGAVLAPWPNRLADGRYRYDGREHRLPLDEPDRRTALHGLVVWERWHLVETDGAEVVLEHRPAPRPGYPFTLRLRAAYRLLPDGLEVVLDAFNEGSSTAPYGCGFHPYLVAPSGTVDDWTLRLPAGTLLETDPVRLLPAGRRPLADAPLGADLDGTTRLGAVRLDHSFTDLRSDPRGRCTAEVRDHDGRGAAISWDAASPWAHVFTGDEPPLDRSGLAVEPMTCPPNALASGEDLVAIRPGGRHTVRWRITSLVS